MERRKTERRKSQLLRAWEVGFRRVEPPLDSSIIADPQFSKNSNKARIQKSVSFSLSVSWPTIKIQPTIVLRRAEIFLQIAATASLHFYLPLPLPLPAVISFISQQLLNSSRVTNSQRDVFSSLARFRFHR